MSLALAALLWPALAAAGERWRIEYFYDPPDGSEFNIAALACPSAQYGMAAGQIQGRGRPKPYAVATTNGGKTWAPITIPESALSLFFLDERNGWLVASNGIWHTADFGTKWTRLKSAPGAVRVWFLDAQRGWAVGDKKAFYQTSDGGATWKTVEVTGGPETPRDDTVYSAIAFAGPKEGRIVGWSRPPRPGERGRTPDWVDPANRPRESERLGLTVRTQDGGASWRSVGTEMLGQATALSLEPDGRGLILIEFFDRYDYPSEVYRFDLNTGQKARSFRRRDRAVTDVLAQAKGPAYLAAVEPNGTLFHSPVPGKLKVLKSDDLQSWTEMPVDYRAVARRAFLAAFGADVRVATDTGMILKLAAE